MTWIGRARKLLVLDLSPLRRSRDLRRVAAGQLVSVLGSQLTIVAVPYQVYALTHTSLAVGLVSLAQVPGLMAGLVAAALTTLLVTPQPAADATRPPGLRSIADGLRYLRGRPAIQGAYVIDINAMVFGMPRAVFPALASTVFGGGARTLGFLYAAPGAGALLGAVTTGWVHRVRRQGRAVIAAVLAWGAAITCFGLARSLPLALVLLAVAGWADVISAVFRSTIIQVSVPDTLRGRLMGVQMAVVTGGPRIG